MMDLRRVFDLWFDDPGISFTEILKYGERHLQRMIANNPGGFLAARVTATTTALNAVESCVTDVGTKLAIQKNKTETKRLFRENLPAGIRRIEGAVIAGYGKDTPDYIECFPEGLTVFTTCRDEELNNKLGVLVNALTPRSATVGATHVTSATGFKTTWETLYSAQSAAMGAREASAEQRDTDRATLRLELYKNVLTIALQYPGQPAKCDLYCPQQYLRNAQATVVPDQATIEATGGAGQINVTGHAAGADTLEYSYRLVGAPSWTSGGSSAPDKEVTFDGLAAGSYEVKARGVNADGNGPESEVAAAVVT